MDNVTIQRRAAANAVSVVARGVLQAGSIVLLTPMLVRYLGAHGFGLWSILYAFVPYAALFDFGIHGALAKHLAELDYRSERDAVSTYISTAILMMCAGLLAVAAVVFSLPGVFAALTVQGLNLAVCILLFAAALLANLSNYALMGLHRQDMASYIGAAFIVVNAVGTVVLLRSGGGVRALTWLNIAISGATVVVCWAIFLKTSGARFMMRVDRAVAKRLLGTGWVLALYGVAALFYLYLGKWIVAVEISVAAVAALEIALRVMVVLKHGISSIASPLMAAASRLAVTSQDAATDLFRNAFRYFSVLSVPAFTAAALFSGLVIRMWMGTGHSESATILTIMAPGFLCGTLSGVLWFILVGAGKSSAAVKVALAEVLGGTIFCWILTQKYGLIGTAAGLSIPGALAMAGYLWVGKKALDIDLWACTLELGRALAVSVTVIGATAFFVSGVESRPLVVIAATLSTMLAYIILALLATSSRERSYVLRFLRVQPEGGAAVHEG